jgi:hypothetical protein
MATQLDFKTLANAQAVWYDGTFVFVSTGSTLYAYSFITNVLTQINSISTGGILGTAPALWKDSGPYIYTHTNVTATLKAFTFSGAAFTQKASIVYPGAGYLPSIGYAVRGDGTYVYRSVDGSGGQKIVAYWWVGTTLTVKTDQAIAGILANSMVCQNSAIYLSNTTRLYRYTYNGTTFTQTHLTAAGTYLSGYRTMDGDGTYLYAALSDATSIRVFNNTLVQVGSDFAEGLTAIKTIHCFDGKILVTAVDAVRIYTFNGSAFTLVDTISSAGSTASGAAS